MRKKKIKTWKTINSINEKMCFYSDRMSSKWEWFAQPQPHSFCEEIKKKKETNTIKLFLC